VSGAACRAPLYQEAAIDTPRFSRRRLGGRLVAAASVAAVGTVIGVTVMAGDDIDPTGESDSTPGVQRAVDAAPDGGVIAIPAGAVIRCTAPITLGGRRKSLVGPGELRFTDGVGDDVALRVTGDGSRVHQVSVTNPRELSSSRGIGIAAHDVVISECWVDRFAYGIVVAADGEWMRTRIMGNRVSNVLGGGGGRGSTSTAGEDRGDGITVWGAQASVVGNVVTAKPGTDARIGIHAEGLQDQEQDTPQHSDAMVTITANVVSGTFRRCIVFEEIDNGTITANTVADGTWWGIAVIEGTGSVVADNTIRVTRSVQDDQGSAHAPLRCGLQLYGGSGHTVSGNTVSVSGVADAFVSLTDLSGRPPTDILVTDNNCRTTGRGQVTRGVVMLGDDGPVRPRLRGNAFVGAAEVGIYLGSAHRPDVSGNTIVGASGCQHGVFGDNDANSGAIVAGNRVVGAGTGIALYGLTNVVLSANVMEGCPIAVDLLGCTGGVVLGSMAIDAATPVANAADNQVLP
jgi:hypothetical protein